jgi:hypothetical protein
MNNDRLSRSVDSTRYNLISVLDELVSEIEELEGNNLSMAIEMERILDRNIELEEQIEELQNELDKLKA